ncbi:MAG: hypothetical protein M5U26_01060 [Planctomycetota bacterium]|nr:hypothetical protein [Planctomycetota bacterium]
MFYFRRMAEEAAKENGQNNLSRGFLVNYGEWARWQDAWLQANEP